MGVNGFLEKFDFNVIDKLKFDLCFVIDYVVGGFYYFIVIGCNKDVVKVCLKIWVELFDRVKFFGKWSFYKWFMLGVLEVVFFVDGVVLDRFYFFDLD